MDTATMEIYVNIEVDVASYQQQHQKVETDFGLVHNRISKNAVSLPMVKVVQEPDIIEVEKAKETEI